MSEQFGFWTVNGSSTFGVMPGDIINGVSEPIPIKLQVGNRYWGVTHIETKHRHWLEINNHTAASMVYRKLSDAGAVYTTEEDDKSKVNLTLNPSAILILRYIPQQKFLTVVSIYNRRDAIDGTFLGRYLGSGAFGRGQVPTPTFEPPVVMTPKAILEPASIVVTYKKTRTL